MRVVFLIGVILYLVILLFTRFYQVAYTARFTQDESGFLVRLHQIYDEKKITLIGQVNEQGKVFGSLTVYLLLPFAIAGDFDPQSLFYGAAFWGVATSLVFLVLGYQINHKLLFPLGLLTLFWFPLVQTGRWAWNPNFVPFWIGLGLICYLNKKPVSYLLMGLFLGLSIHHHYYAIFAAGFFCFLAGIEAIIKKKFHLTVFLWIGFGLTLLPFLLFDLRHPPGLFFLGASKQSAAFQIRPGFWNDSWELILYFTQSVYGAICFLLLGSILLIDDIRMRSKALIFLGAIIFQRLALWIAAPYFFHYYLVSIPFLLVWIMYPRNQKMLIVSYCTISILVIGSLFQIISLITKPPVTPDLPTQVVITDTLKKDLDRGLSPQPNIAVLASLDHDVQAVRYRDILLGRYRFQFDSRDEYFHSNHLYVVSTASEEVVRSDVAPEIHNFTQGPLVNKFPIAKTPWVIYHFSKAQP